MSDLSLRAIATLEKEFGVRIYTDFDICTNTWKFAIIKDHKKIIITEGPKFLSDSDIIVKILRNKLTNYFIDNVETVIQKPELKLKCPNCGANHNGVKCEYCDTVFTYNLCTPDLSQEYINECYKLATQAQDLEMRKVMGFFDYPLPKHLL